MRHESAFERFASDVSDVAVSETACVVFFLVMCPFLRAIVAYVMSTAD